MDRGSLRNISVNTPHPNEYHRPVDGRIISRLITTVIATVSIGDNIAVVAISFQEELLLAPNGNLLIVSNLSSTDILTSLCVMTPSGISFAYDFSPLEEEL